MAVPGRRVDRKEYQGENITTAGCANLPGVMMPLFCLHSETIYIKRYYTSTWVLELYCSLNMNM